MTSSPGRFGALRWPPTRGWRWRLLSATLLAIGISLLLVSSAFLLAGRRDDAPPPSAADFRPPQADQDEAQPTPQAPTAEQERPLDVGLALARVDARALYGGLVRLVAALRPTPTPIPTPTPTPTPTTERPAAPPQQIVAPPAPPRQSVAPAAPPSAPTPTPTPQAPPAQGCPTASMSGFALALFNAINNERTQAGLATLAAHGCLVYVAQLRSDDMASRGYFSHTSPDGETAFSLLDHYGVPHGWAGENLARNNYPDDESVGIAIRDLMASEGHRANILSGNYTDLGVGLAVDGAGMKYFTMVFIGPP